eukprot:jgi/Astpho2/27/fgenesh1_pm.00001_%23_4_t
MQSNATTPEATKWNFLIHHHWLRQNFDECLRLVEQVLQHSNGTAEYALQIKALIQRQRGEVSESLQLCQQAVAINRHSVATLKQVGRSLCLLGRFTTANDVYKEALQLVQTDWELWHSQGMVYTSLKVYDRAIECLQRACSIEAHDSSFMQLARLHALQGRYQAALDVLFTALQFSPDSSEVLTTIGLLYLRMGDNMRAFEYLGSSLAHDPRNPKTILAAASVIQDHSDMDVALVKYRVAAVQTPNSPQLWNNVGMCFFGKQRYVAAISCLKRALYLGPFEWIIGYNLGLVHLATGQNASAFHFLSSSLNLKSDFAHTYMYLAITLARLEDFDNACAAMEKALELEDDMLFHLNYAVILWNNSEPDLARDHFLAFKKIFSSAAAEVQAADSDVQEQDSRLSRLLGSA